MFSMLDPNLILNVRFLGIKEVCTMVYGVLLSDFSTLHSSPQALLRADIASSIRTTSLSLSLFHFKKDLVTQPFIFKIYIHKFDA
jgi:hypothetical protein